jgi:outer membrane protein assembly factor BamD
MRRAGAYLLAALLFACGGAPEIVEQKTMPEMYARAYEQIDDKNYTDAAQTFLDAETTYPTSGWSADALVMAAYSQYQAGDFAGAITTIDRFMRFHPGHKDVDYVMYLRGMCFYRQVSDVRREPGMSAYALGAFGQLTQRFPKSQYAKNAENKIRILKNYIAGKTMYSVRRELRRQNYPVAITNLQNVIMTMPETQMTPEALFRLTEAYAAIGLPEQSAGYGEMLKKNFPDSVWAKKVKK